MIEFSRFTAWMLAALLLLASCAKETLVAPGTESGDGEEVEVQFRIGLPALPAEDAATKAGTDVGPGNIYLGNYPQTQLSTADVLVFDRNLKFVDHKQGNSLSQTGSIATFSTTLKASRNTGDNYRIMVLANFRERLAVLFGTANLGGHKGETYDQICALLNDAMTWNVDALLFKFAMWGEFEDFVVISKATTNTLPTMTLLRAWARIDVGLNSNGVQYVGGNPDNGVVYEEMSNFEIRELCLYKPNTRYSIAPQRNKYSFQNKCVTDLTIPASPATSDSYFRWHNQLTEGNGYSLGYIFLPETDVDLKNGAGKRFDDKHLQRAALVVGGKYNGSPNVTYYRIDFRDPGSATPDKLYDILRNHCYQIVITKVSDEGYPTPDEAYNSMDTRIDATIVKWTPAPVAVVFDGQYYMKLNHDKIVVGSEGATVSIPVHVHTNHPNGASCGMIIDLATGNYPSLVWVTGYYQSDSHDGIATGHMLRNYSEILPNNTGSNRTIREMFTAGNMQYAFFVEQSKNPWLVTTPQNPYLPDGAVHALDVTAITDWTVEVKMGTNDAGAVAQLLTTKGTKGSSKVYFRTIATIANYPSVTLVFRDPKGVNPSKEVTLTINMPVSYRFAKSNIVLGPVVGGEQTLTFASSLNGSVDHKGTIIPANVQGLLFKWGSLFGIAGTRSGTGNDAYSSSSHLKFKPEGLSGGSSWASVPSVYDLADDGNTSKNNNNLSLFLDQLYYPSGYNLSAGTGDICRYMTYKGWVPPGTKWRIPTYDDFRQLYNEAAMINAQKNYVVGPWSNIKTTITGSGEFQMPSGVYTGIGINSISWTPESVGATIENTPMGVIFLPANATRDYSGTLMGVGTDGYYYSSTPYYEYEGSPSRDARNMAIRSTGSWESMTNRAYAYPIRCIRYE